ncbi:cupin [alpha proteobacterium AAP81b]|nr:cupin [alpha proteobacterium AAP81b]
MTANLATNFVHLGLGATAVPQPAFSGMDWYQGYGARHDGDGAEGRLVSLYTFDSSWDSWEMHPAGEELVVCTAGSITLTQEAPDGTLTTVTLDPGDYVINPRGVWHTADVTTPCTCLFITAGLGTEHRPR